MISYLTLGTNDLERAGRFYDAALAPLGRVRLPAVERELWYGQPGGPTELVILHPFDGRPATWGNGVTVGLSVPDEATVIAMHAAALAAGGLDEGAPGLRLEYSPDFYAAYVRDPDGNKLAFVRAAKPA